MRDIIITLAVIIGLGYTIKKPHIGILVWSWLGYMNPHRLCYGFAYSLPFTQVTAIVTTAATLFSNEKKQLPKHALVYCMLLFTLWVSITTIFALEPENALNYYIRFLKIQYPILLTLLLFNTQQRIHQLLWIIIISLGYYGTKGGIFTLITAGSYRVFGPEDSVIAENNALAVATLMVMPLLVYMRNQLTKNWQRHIILFCLISMGFSVLGSQSRGAFLAISAVGAYFWFQSNNKLYSGILIAVFVSICILFLPESWYQRMNTIETYNQDDSAMGRINAWTMAFNVANHNLLGGGFDLWSIKTYSQYLDWFDPLTMTPFVAHSIYFSVLGEHGWIGLFLFLFILYLAWRYCGQIITQCRSKPDMQWLADLAKMIKISLLAYCSGGAFLSLSYFDLPWHLISIVILLKNIMLQNKLQPLTNQDIEQQNSEYNTLKPKIIIDHQGYIK